MKIKTKCLSLIGFCFCAISLSAQYQSAARIENYGGSSSIFLNPASSSVFPLRWDLNIISGDFYIDNSVGYISNTSVFDLKNNADQIKAGWDMEPQGSSSLVADMYRDTLSDKYAQVSTSINGPAFVFNTNGGQSIGAFYNFRAMGGSPKIPGSLNYYSYIDKQVDEFIDFSTANFSFLAWDEIGVHFSNRFLTGSGYISAGINLKYIRGYEAAYFSLNNDTDIQFASSNQVVVNGLDFQYAYTTNNTDVADGAEYELQPVGKGFAVDLGVNYVVEDDSDTYKLRLGASLNDIGGVTFKSNAEVHGLRGAQSITFDESTYQSFTTIEEVRDQASADVFNAIGLSQLDMPLSMAMPTSFSLQADYKIVEYVYASAVFINRISFSPYAVKATNFISIAPRFEHRWGMFSIPVNITEYNRVKVGAAVRLGYFIIGTDDLSSFLGTSEFRSTDIYFGVKANPFSIGSGSKGGRRNSSSGKRGKVKCYKF